MLFNIILECFVIEGFFTAYSKSILMDIQTVYLIIYRFKLYAHAIQLYLIIYYWQLMHVFGSLCMLL